MKYSRHERERRAQQVEAVRRIESAWLSSLPADVRSAFERDAAIAHLRGPLPRQPDMAPGTQPNPPRPGHEPRAPKEPTTRRRAY